jgi:hypothetical protein
MHIKNLFTPLTPAQASQKELEDAQREVLKAYTGKDYAESVIAYHEKRIERLKAFLEGESK